MSEKIKAGFYIETEMKSILAALADTDRRSMSAELEWLIQEEFTRRRKANALVDTPAPYEAELEPA